MTKLQEERASSPKNTKAIAPHKLMRTWRYKETKHSLKKKAKSVTLNFPLSLCSFTAKDNIPPCPSPPQFQTPSPSPPSSPVRPTTPPCHVAPTNVSLPPIPVNSPTHEFYWDQRNGLRSIALAVSRPRMEDPLAYFKSLSSSDKIRLPIPSLPHPAIPGSQATPLTCYG